MVERKAAMSWSACFISAVACGLAPKSEQHAAAVEKRLAAADDKLLTVDIGVEVAGATGGEDLDDDGLILFGEVIIGHGIRLLARGTQKLKWPASFARGRP